MEQGLSSRLLRTHEGPAEQDLRSIDRELHDDLWSQSAAFAAEEEAKERDSLNSDPEGEDLDWLAAMTDGRATTQPISVSGSLGRKLGLPAVSQSGRRSLPKALGRRSAHTAAATSASDFSSVNEEKSNALRYPTHLANPTPYQLFHLPTNASQAEIKARYYDLVRVMHPDRHFSLSSDESRRQTAINGSQDKGKAKLDDAQQQFREIVAAYELLRDVRKRRLYDAMGVGWGSGSGTGSSPFSAKGEWNGSGAPAWWGRRGPRTQQEWELFHAWSNHVRRSNQSSGSRYGWEARGSPAGGQWRGHDGFGWQRYAGGQGREDFSFYGFSAQHRAATSGSRITSNVRLFASIAVVTWLVAAVQYQRLSAQSARAVERADQKHLDAVRSLSEARQGARSEEGKRRLAAMRRRAREAGLVKQVDQLSQVEGNNVDDEAIAALGVSHAKALELEERLQNEQWATSIGHGGPSGREAHDQRRARQEGRTPI